MAITWNIFQLPRGDGWLHNHLEVIKYIPNINIHQRKNLSSEALLLTVASDESWTRSLGFSEFKSFYDIKLKYQ